MTSFIKIKYKLCWRFHVFKYIHTCEININLIFYTWYKEFVFLGDYTAFLIEIIYLRDKYKSLSINN